MLRQQLRDALKIAMKAREARAVATIRLILAALKDRDIAARGKGGEEELSDADILQLLTTMIRQRRESIELYQTGGRVDLAEREGEEIDVIERFMPAQIEGEEMIAIIRRLTAEIGAQSIKDMGRTMAALKEQFAGQMDFGKASGVVRELLA